MPRKDRTPPKLFSDFNTLQFASVMCMVMLVPLVIFMTLPVHHGGYSVDLPKVLHPVAMPEANREDAMIINITRDGKVYFGTEQVSPITLSAKLADRLKGHATERKVYIKADMRARWGTIKPVLDGVHAAGILRVAFLVDQRRVSLIASR